MVVLLTISLTLNVAFIAVFVLAFIGWKQQKKDEGKLKVSKN